MTDLPVESFRDGVGRVRPGWRTALASLLCLGFSPSVLQVMSLGVFAPHLREEFGWTLAQISVAATILALMVTIVSPLQGLLIDRFGARRLILISIPLFGLGYAMASQISGNVGSLYLVWALLPAVGIGLWPGSYVKATSSWFDRRLGLAIGLATAGIGIGAAVFPLVIQWFAGQFGWRTAFVAIGVASVAIGWPVAFRYIHDAAPQTGPVQAAGVETRAQPSAAGTFAVLVAAFLLLGIFSTSILFHLVSILIGNGMERSSAVGAQAALGLMLIVGRLASGALVDRASVRLVLPAFAILATVGLGLLLAGATGPSALFASALAGLLIGAEIDILGFVIKRYFGLKRYGTLYGVLFAVFQLGGALGVYTLALLSETRGSYTLGLAVLMGSCLGAGLLFGLLPTYRRDHPARANAA